MMIGMFGEGFLLNWQLDPLAVLRRWPRSERVLMLHSGRHHRRWAQQTILAQPNGTYRYTRADCQARSQWTGADTLVDRTALTHQPFHDLQILHEALKKTQGGMWVGYLSYDLGKRIEHLPDHRCMDRGFPLIELAYCNNFLVYDLARQTWRAYGAWAQTPPQLQDPDSIHSQGAWAITQAPQSATPRNEYVQAVKRSQQYIAAGDIFQVNLSQRFTAELSAQLPHTSRRIFDHLSQVSPAWYGAYLELDRSPITGKSKPQPARSLASISPELFIEIDSEYRIVTRPIKGTRPAGVPADELLHSEKDKAELAMIVDLLRNDLGRVCDYRSIRVDEPRTIESHPTVHHGVATITGRLHSSQTLIDLLKATLPGGSITGAPKIRAMQIIDEIEPVARGPYCGCIGYMTSDHACFNIAIRTMMLEQLEPNRVRADFHAGGGIVADSSPEAEYQETLDKAAAMFTALAGAAPQQKPGQNIVRPTSGSAL